VQVRYPGALVANPGQHQLRSALAFEQELDSASPGVAVGIAGDLGDRRGNPRLILCVEPEQPGYLARALSGNDDVLLVVEGYGQKCFSYHGPMPLLMATTLTSSRPRSWS